MSSNNASADPVTRFRLTDQYQQLKSAIHKNLIAQIEERNLDIDRWEPARVANFVSEQVRLYVTQQRLPVNARETEALSKDARDELMGFGPIQSLVDDDTVNDIVVNGPNRVFIERDGKLSTATVRFVNDAHVLRVIQRILSPIGRRVDESTPMVDARLQDGSRVNAIIPPIALDGPCVSIRKFRKSALKPEDLVRTGSISQAALDYLKVRVHGRTNLIVIGGTGSGKTTFLNMLSQWVPSSERIITVEDAAELRLHHAHTVRLESRPPNLEGQKAVSARDLVRNALRMRPDRLIVGEVRGGEAFDMVQAMNTGHDGSMSTCHANSVVDALRRLETMVLVAGSGLPLDAIREQIGSSIDLVIHVARGNNGCRRIVDVADVDSSPDGWRAHSLIGRAALTDGGLHL